MIDRRWRIEERQVLDFQSDFAHGSSVLSILTFDKIEANDLSRVGGKGLNLGLLFRAGLPVPDGFCVTAASGMQEAGGPERANGAQPDCVLSTEYSVLSTQYHKSSVPNPHLNRTDLLAAYARLGAGPVAVRSSAVSEDGTGQ